MKTSLDEHIQQFVGQYRRTSYEERLLADMKKAKELIKSLNKKVTKLEDDIIKIVNN